LEVPIATYNLNFMSKSLLRLQSIFRQTSRSRLAPSKLHVPISNMSVRKSFYLPILLVTLVAIGLRLYLQTGSEKITEWVRPDDKSGEFKRGQSAFRNFISRKPGAQFPPEKDRYHLYVSYACPWGMFSSPCKPHGSVCC
jgi:hypothetical protein